MSFYSLFGYRSFKTENEIKNIVIDFINENHKKLSVSNIDISSRNLEVINTYALKIFQTPTQVTWVVARNGYFFCLLDDIELNKNVQIIRWYKKIVDIKDQITFEDSYRKPEKVGIINFGDMHKGWLYSKNVIGNDEMAKKYINNLVVSGSSAN
ncbi:hypothetical protein [Aurantibacillus circumpalustris]|uniref:hypothetical protein n=1 Tax=Aurantibacillus circumpalustris TaxID=3036359 RepID=UPI00295A78AE|nr:hypothetical protein [Aurantibacillus circumpalustris]